eukprot:TRINITY_DN45862_c0_g1_i1.p1 TRINITY_DN45862_c0_g1~~TRINITY_DN45862_c0_g1_i1.p1  ORF type:complete len:379 (+),score=47.46 TRINITY_DN45862_c0_g1_i1:72-1139(+)
MSEDGDGVRWFFLFGVKNAIRKLFTVCPRSQRDRLRYPTTANMNAWRQSGSRHGAVSEGEMKIAVRLMSGTLVELPPLPVDAPMCALRETIQSCTGIRACAQRLILGHVEVVADDNVGIGKALTGLLPPGSSSEDVELALVRGVLSESEQRIVDDELMLAAAEGDAVATASALAEGARPTAQAARRGADAVSPLMLALAAGNEDVVSLLRKAGAEEPDMTPKTQRLGRAFARGDLADVVRLLACGESPRQKLRRGDGVQHTHTGYPLHACCALHRWPGSTAVAVLLCHLRADMQAKDSEGDTPLAHARFFDAKDIHCALHARGAKIQGPYYSFLYSTSRAVFERCHRELQRFRLL